jgi:hypothetical protein
MLVGRLSVETPEISGVHLSMAMAHLACLLSLATTSAKRWVVSLVNSSGARAHARTGEKSCREMKRSDVRRRAADDG